jgi:predicted lipoprotein with Yx(FWY)xxD motif
MSTRPVQHRVAAGAFIGAAVLATAAACGMNSGGSGYGSGSSTGSGSSGSTATGLGTESTSLGTILTDKAGHTLYGFAADSKGSSNCYGSCATYWPPVVVTGKLPADPSGVSAKVGEVTRTDGTKQLTIDGWPMYTYVGDTAAGDTKGQGLNLSGGLWWVVGPNGAWIKSPAGGTSTTGSTSGSSSSPSSSSGGRGGY